MASLIFSIIIPTYNRPKNLKVCLSAIAQQNFSKTQFEVIVIDDGSDYSPQEIVNTFKNHLQITCITQTNKGPASARNKGALHAKGKFLVFTDDDCAPHKNWLEAFENCYTQNPNAAIGGKSINKLTHNLYSTTSQRLIDYLYQYYNHPPDKAKLLTSNNLAVPKDLYLKIGGFNDSFPLAAGEDREFCDRWKSEGNPLIYKKNIQVDHSHHLDLSSFWRQHFNYGRGAWKFHQLHARRYTTKIKIEPLSFYINLIRKGSDNAEGLRRIQIILLLIISQIANALGFFYAKYGYKIN